jgi:hypothetical protein
MPLGPTYYDFFGVARTAAPGEIRSAYVLLMKQYHPDLTQHGDRQRAAHFAAILNRYYCVLKDPHKRIRYDAWLSRQSAGGGKANVRSRPLLTGATTHAESRRWDASSKGAAFLACLSVLLVVAALSTPSETISRRAQAAVLGSTAIASRPLPRADFRAQVSAAMNATADQAEQASRRCFASARDRYSVPETDMCVIFDDVYIDWHSTTPMTVELPVYFNETVVRLRHTGAMIAINASPRRIDGLKQTALNALLAEIKSQVGKGGNSQTSPIAPLGADNAKHRMSR